MAKKRLTLCTLGAIVYVTVRQMEGKSNGNDPSMELSVPQLKRAFHPPRRSKRSYHEDGLRWSPLYDL